MRLSARSHTLAELVAVGPLQQSAIRDFQRTKSLDSDTPTHKIIEISVPIFDNLFFDGTMKGLLQVVATGEEAIEEYGYTENSRHRDGVYIAVNTVFDDGQGRVLRRLGVVLHEMIHAFLMIYMKTEYRKQSSSFYGEGFTGHGAAWQDIAYALEKATKDLLGLRLPMGRDDSLLWETSLSKKEINASRWDFHFQRRDRPRRGRCSTTVLARQHLQENIDRITQQYSVQRREPETQGCIFQPFLPLQFFMHDNREHHSPSPRVVVQQNCNGRQNGHREGYEDWSLREFEKMMKNMFDKR